MPLDLFFFFKQKTAYEMRISDWSSDVCSSDLPRRGVSCGHRADFGERRPPPPCPPRHGRRVDRAEEAESPDAQMRVRDVRLYRQDRAQMACAGRSAALPDRGSRPDAARTAA